MVMDHAASKVIAVPNSTILVSSTAELLAALKIATGGEEIILQGGSYDYVNVRSKDSIAFNYAAPVTIRSADPADEARILHMNLNNVSNLTFENITFDYQFKAGDPLFQTPFDILSSQNIRIRDSTFLGDNAVSGNLQDDGFPTGIGLSVINSSGITVESTDFSTWMRGALFTKSKDLVLVNNEIHDSRSEGFNFAQVQNLLIEGNYFHDFRGSITSGDHRDMIQFWSGRTNAPSTDITIRDNHFDVGDGTWTQTIFMRNEAVDVLGAGPEMYYQNVLIEQNVIVAQHHHGITLGQTNGLTIQDNTVLREEAGQGTQGVWTPKINVAPTSTDVYILDNVTGGVTGHSDQADWQVSGNLIVQDSDSQSANFYDLQFVNPVPGDRGNLANIQVLPNSLIDQAGIGADMLNPNGATGGTTGGTTTGDTTTGDTPGAVLLSYDPATGQILSHETGALINLTGLSQPDQDVAAASGPLQSIQLKGSQSSFEIPEDQLQGFFTARNFSLDLHVQADADSTSAGGLVRLHNALIMRLTDDGCIWAQMTNSDGDRFYIKTPPVGEALSDGTNVSLYFDSDAGTFGLKLDGTEFAATEAFGETAEIGYWGLTLGTAYGYRGATAEITGLSLSTNVDTAEIEVLLPDPISTLAGLFEAAEFGGYQMSLDIQDTGLSGKLRGDDVRVDTVEGELHLDGQGGYADLGRLTAYEHSSAIAMSVEYSRDQADGSTVRLMWNHMKMGLELVGDDLRLRLGTADEGFKLFTVKNVGLNDTETHKIMLAMDEDADVFDLIIDDELVLEHSDVDLSFTGGGEWGWWIGAAVGRALDGTVHDFQLTDLPGGIDSFEMYAAAAPVDVGDFLG